jgi:hypothetical protein
MVFARQLVDRRTCLVGDLLACLDDQRFPSAIMTLDVQDVLDF